MRDGRLSVLHFSNETVRGGIEEHILVIMRGLDRSRFRLHLACPKELAARLACDLPEDVEVISVDLSHVSQLRGWLSLAQCLVTRKVDIVHSHGAYGSMFASPTGRLSGVPVVIETSHAREVWRKGWLTSCFVWDRFVGRFVDRYIAVCESNVRYLTAEKGLPREKIVVIRPGTDLSHFHPAVSGRPGGKVGLGFAATDPLLLVVGRLEPQKGHHVLLDSMPHVLGSFPNAKLVCLSDGSLRSELEHKVKALHLSHSVRFVGYQADTREWLALADVVVLPSLYEGMPMSPVEALASERAVIATAVDGTPEIVVHEKTGLTVPPEHPGALAAAICRLLGDAVLRRRLAVAGREWVLTRFSQERLVRDLEQFYIACWNSRSRREIPHNCSVPSRDQALGRIHER